MAVLLRSLPAEARLSRLPGDEVVWTSSEELLARLLEETSVLVADKRRKQPLEIPRPLTVSQVEEQAKPKARGLSGLLAIANETGRVRSG